jgi:signal transduction histidine kinase/CheY-like chemotaxis protein
VQSADGNGSQLHASPRPQLRKLLVALSLAGIVPMTIVAAVLLATLSRAQPGLERSSGALGGLLVLVLVASCLFVWLLSRRLGEVLRDPIAAAPGGASEPPAGARPEEIERLAEALEEERRARHAAQAANQRKEDFLALLGHELRNPLGAIADALSVIERLPSGSADYKAARAVIGRQTEQLAQIVDDLRDVAGAASGRVALRRNLVDLAQAAASAVALAKHRSSREWQLELHPVLVSADPTRMDQVLANLLGEAVSATAPGADIRVSLREDAGEALLHIEHEEHAPHAAAKGIGLTLAQRLVELHGGRFSAEQRDDGKGARFTVRLPAIPEPQPGTGRERPPPPAPRPSRQARVLLVEDNDDARVMLQRILQAHGHLVSAARDAPAGLEAAAAGSPNVAIVDIGLPGMNGYEFARAMRERLGSGVRLIAVTGYGTESDRQRALQAGFDAHFTKPVDFERLLGLIAEA